MISSRQETSSEVHREDDLPCLEWVEGEQETARPAERDWLGVGESKISAALRERMVSYVVLNQEELPASLSTRVRDCCCRGS